MITNKKFKLNASDYTVATCIRKPGELITRDHLAITPADMERLQSQGIPIAAATSSQFLDGDTNPSWHIDSQFVRGVDPADLWNMQQESRRHIRDAHLKDKNSYDD